MILTFRRPLLAIGLAALVAEPAVAYWNVKSVRDESSTRQEKLLVDVDVSPDANERVLVDEDVAVEYGVDVSLPIHHAAVSTNYAWLPHNLDENEVVPPEYEDMPVQPLGDRESFYDEFLGGCMQKFGPKGGSRCLMTEKDRLEMNLRQPKSMQNYTEIGFTKIRAPEAVYKLIKEFWERNKHIQTDEAWGIGNTYTNNWVSQSTMVSVEDSSLRGGGYRFKQQIWDAAKATIQEWTGEELTECSLYGVRVYHEGSVLATHVDRLPLVSSAIINVAQDVDEPWPLEVYGHDGKATNVTMEPGDMVLYESHSVLHGRPFPLKGRFVANLFVHFEPTGHSLRHHNMDGANANTDVHKQYREALARGVGGHESNDHGLPPYIIPDSGEAENWRKEHPESAGGNDFDRPDEFATGSTSMAHEAAQAGDLAALRAVVEKDKDVVHARDANGWTPLHESVRMGHLELVKYLVEHGADANATTNGDESVLWLAKQELGDEGHPVIDFLESIGAMESGPEL